MAADFERYKPQRVFIWAGSIGDRPFDFVSWFSQSEEFAHQWASYRKNGTIELKMHDYYKNSELDDGKTLHYDIYRRVEDREDGL